MKIIPVSNPDLSSLEREMLLEAFDSTWISSKGEFINKFEIGFAEFIGTKHAITTSNGTVSLHLILLALGIKDGDEIIVPTFTYIASVNAIKYCGATPVFVDSEIKTWNIDPEDVKNKITNKTKVIMVPHLYGQPADLRRIGELAMERGVFIVEDAAEAIGARYYGNFVGSFGIAGSFSFFGNKTITTGEGGMIVTNDSELDKRIKKLKNQGNSEDKKYWHDVIGYNYRMTNLQAAIGYAQLLRIDELVWKKRKIASLYRKYLNHPRVKHPSVIENFDNSYWMYSVLIDFSTADLRDQFIDDLYNKFGIETRPFFYPVHLLPMYRDTTANFPNVDQFYFRGVNFPSSTTLTEEEIVYITESVKEQLSSMHIL